MLFEWQRPATLPTLGLDELQLFRIDLKHAVGGIDSHKPGLSAIEIERSERLRAGQVREQFVVGRACLRVLLGNLLGITPRDVPLTLTAFGKPELPPTSKELIYFNVAHSRELVLIALSRSGPVGVDLEHMDRNADALELARSAFTSTEILQIEQITDLAARQQAFFHGWTRKEAVVKADGRGLSLPLDSFEVPILQAAHAASVLVAEDVARGEVAREWLVTDIALGGGFAAACAVRFGHTTIRGFDFPVEILSSDTSRP